MTRSSLVLTAVIAGAGLSAGAIAIAQAPPTQVTACVKKQGGGLRIVGAKTKCKAKSERRLAWNTQGPAGTAGANGTNGTTGAPGTNGTNGADGADGLSEAYSGSRPADVAIGASNVLIGRLALPTAGNYVINAKVSLESTTNTIATTAVCELVAGSDSDSILTKLGRADEAGTGFRDAVALQLVHTAPAAGSVTLACRVGNATTGEASGAQITAIRVDDLTSGPLATS